MRLLEAGAEWGKRGMRYLVLAGLCLALLGCVSAEQQAIADNQTCLDYGAQPGTDGYLQCRLLVAQMRAAEEQRQAAARATLGAGLQNAGAAYNANLPPPQPAFAPIQPPINCRSVRTGNVVNTQCY